MARSITTNATWFKHDRNLRRSKLMLLVRKRFQSDGYAIVLMLLEIITESPKFRLNIDNFQLESLSVDFGIDMEIIQNVIRYGLEIGLFKLCENNELFSPELNESFNSLITKRQKDRERQNSRYDNLRNDASRQNSQNVDDIREIFAARKCETPPKEIDLFTQKNNGG